MLDALTDDALLLSSKPRSHARSAAVRIYFLMTFARLPFSPLNLPLIDHVQHCQDMGILSPDVGP